MPSVGRKSELTASLLPSRGPKRGRNCYVTPAFSGGPQHQARGEIRIGCLTPALSGARKWAQLLCYPCIFGGPQRQVREGNQNWLPHPSFLGGPQVGDIATSPLHSRGSPNAKRGEKIRIGCLTPAFSGAHKWAELLRHPCILGGLQCQARGENQNWLPRPQVGGIATSPLHSRGSPKVGIKSELPTSPLPS